MNSKESSHYLEYWCRRPLCLLVAVLLIHDVDAVDSERPNTTLAVAGGRFIINGQPVFLLGFSYFSALGAPEEFIRRDLDGPPIQHFDQTGNRQTRTFRQS